MNLVESIKSLKKDVQSYKDDNYRLMKSREHQYGINIRLFQILDRIEKKVDKGIYSRKSKRNISHGKIQESRSVYKHHHHSPIYLVKREQSSSSPSSVKKHKRRSE
jgi:hypothetical protein